MKGGGRYATRSGVHLTRSAKGGGSHHAKWALHVPQHGTSLTLAVLALLLCAGAASAKDPVKGPNSPLTWTLPELPPHTTPVTGYEVLLCQTAPGCTATPEARVVPIAAPASGATVTIKMRELAPLASGTWWACVRAVNAAGKGGCSAELNFDYAGGLPPAPAGLK